MVLPEDGGVWGLGFRVSGFGFRVVGLGLKRWVWSLLGVFGVWVEGTFKELPGQGLCSVFG